jgi:hypothetical protein
MGPECLPYGVFDGVGCPEPMTLRGDMYEKRFLCGVEGVIEGGARVAVDFWPGGVCLLPRSKKLSGDVERWS